MKHLKHRWTWQTHACALALALWLCCCARMLAFNPGPGCHHSTAQELFTQHVITACLQNAVHTSTLRLHSHWCCQKNAQQHVPLLTIS